MSIHLYLIPFIKLIGGNKNGKEVYCNRSREIHGAL